MHRFHALAIPFACASACAFAAAPEQGESRDVALVVHEAKQCALGLALPASWILEESRDDSACVVTARESSHESRCGAANDDKVLCDPERQAIVSIRAGDIATAAGWPESDLYPFHVEDGKWRLTNAHLSERDAIPLRGEPRRILYADYATREHYQDGSYCCTGRNWWAMVELTGRRIAFVEVTWDFIGWDDDTTSWTDATDARARRNVEQFLRALR